MPRQRMMSRTTVATSAASAFLPIALPRPPKADARKEDRLKYLGEIEALWSSPGLELSCSEA
jgi:hypothetical protein